MTPPFSFPPDHPAVKDWIRKNPTTSVHLHKAKLAIQKMTARHGVE
jgi:hypothetical protein